MDVRFEVLKIDGIWMLTQRKREMRPFGSQSAAITAEIAEACRHHEEAGGRATVHLWRDGIEEVIFETVNDSAEPQRG
jgi:hypothetical protein